MTIQNYDPKKEELLKLIDSRPRVKISKSDIIEGVICGIKNGVILVNVNGKSEGIISGRELASEDYDVKSLNIGSKIFVYVLSTEKEKEGQLNLSLKRADTAKKWIELENAKESQELVEALVVDANTGGLLVKVKGGIPAFIPTSQIDSVRLAEGFGLDESADESRSEMNSRIPFRLSQFIGQKLFARVIEVVKDKNKVVLSEKVSLSKTDIEARDDVFRNAQQGDVFDAVVTGVTTFGLFVNAQGMEGLVHLSEISWDKVSDPSDYYKVGDKLKVQLMNVAEDGKRVAFSVKRLIPDPWLNSGSYKAGTTVEGIIQKINNFNVHVKLKDGVNGVIHLSEFTEPPKVGESYEFKIFSISNLERHLNLTFSDEKVQSRIAKAKKKTTA